jgi:cytosine deaminase
MTALLLTNVNLGDGTQSLTELRIENGVFVDQFSDAELTVETRDMLGRLVIPGLVETHIHLDKACILDRCAMRDGTLDEAIMQTSTAKSAFTEKDIYARGAEVIERAIMQGTTLMRTHVELDPIIGLTGFNAIKRLQQDYAWAVELEICVFPQEGLLNNPGTETLLCEALDTGATVLGGCPYTDDDPKGQIRRLFEIAQQYDCDLDFHLDFDLDVEAMTIPEVIQCTLTSGWQNRVTIGHVTKLSALSPQAFRELALEIAEAGIHVTTLPSTDLFLMGRGESHNIPRGVAPIHKLHKCGVTCSISTNNIGNPFTPFGDASLVRQANLFANISQLGTASEMVQCLAWISSESAKLLGRSNYGLQVGCQADFIVFDVNEQQKVVAEISQPLMGFKAGIQTFERKLPSLIPPR